ncbi:hypothetical protein BVX94_00605 [bacterium B17]|nr:hypothetical protein BVX94_00605 [bacterium B17]
MSRTRNRIKTWLEVLPRPIGGVFKHIPYSWRLGPEYERLKNEISIFSGLGDAEKQCRVLKLLQRAVRDAYDDNEFYRDYYSAKGFNPDVLKEFSDIAKIPIVTRSELQRIDIDQRSSQVSDRMLINTGGTSGQPLSFYTDKNAFAREWAHMHWIWSRLGYKQTDLKLTFRGKDLGNDTLRYNPVHNEYIVNHYKPFSEQANYIEKIADKVKYIHGYPSAIYAFMKYCRNDNTAFLNKLKKNLKGVLLGSEYPAPIYRDLIDETLNVPSTSWYGHSEMAVLAYEEEKNVYVPMHTYGFCEAIKDDRGQYHLTGTSYYNNASPFIRYDTGDIVEPEFNDGLLQSFKISSGRTGDFIKDKNGQDISLTALIFGRHHPLFNWAEFVQVSQEEDGKATIHISTDKDETGLHPENDFNTENVAIDFEYQIRQTPYSTPAGKVPLLIQE